MSVFLIFLLFLLFSLQPFAEENVQSADLSLPDVTLSAEYTVYILPPPFIRADFIRLPELNYERIHYRRVSRPSLIFEITKPQRKINPVGQPEPPGPRHGLTGEVTYLPGSLLDLKMEMELEAGSWDLVTDLAFGLADRWLNPDLDSEAHFQFGLKTLAEPGPFSLKLYLDTGVFSGSNSSSRPRGSDETNTTLLSAGKEISAGSARIGISEMTVLKGIAPGFTSGQQQSRQNWEGLLGEEIKIEGFSGTLGAYGVLDGYLWSAGSSMIGGAGKIGLGGILAPPDNNFTLSGGGVLLFYDRAGQPDPGGPWFLYPEGELVLALSPVLTFKAGAGPYLKTLADQELFYLIAYLDRPIFQTQKGFAVKSGFQLELSTEQRSYTFLEYLDGSLYRISGDRLMLVEETEQLVLSSGLTWRIFAPLGPGRPGRPGLTLGLNHKLKFALSPPGLTLPDILSNTMHAFLKIDFINIPLEFMIKCLLGSYPEYEFDQRIAGNWYRGSRGWFSIKTIWTFSEPSTLALGLEILNPEEQAQVRFLVSLGIWKIEE